MYDKVIYKRRGVHAFEVFAQKCKALAADLPVFFCVYFATGNARAHREARELEARLAHLFEGLFGGVFGEFDHEHELGYAAGQYHPHLGYEGKSKSHHLEKTHLM